MVEVERRKAGLRGSRSIMNCVHPRILDVIRRTWTSGGMTLVRSWRTARQLIYGKQVDVGGDFPAWLVRGLCNRSVWYDISWHTWGRECQVKSTSFHSAFWELRGDR